MDTDKMTHAMARWWQSVNERSNDPDARPMLYDPLQGSRTTKSNQYLATVIVCMAAAAAGTGLAWTSPVLGQLEKPDSLIETTKEQRSWIASMLAIGAICGALPCGILADKLGRKKAAMFISVPYIVSFLMTATASSPFALYAARFLIGIVIGGSCVVAPVFISEFAETSIRGSLGTCFQLFLTVGILFVFCVGAVVNWVQLSWLCLVFPILNFVGLFFVPESPIWLLKQRRDDEARSSIKWFWGRFCNAEGAIQAIKTEMESSGGGSGSIRDLFAVTANRRGFCICIMLMFFQQFSGINAVIFYSVQIFQSAGSKLDPSICSIIVGVVQVLMTFASAALVERAGRKILLLISSTVMCLCLGVLGVYFYMKDNGSDVSNIGMVPLLSLVLFIVCFSIGYGPIPWMMMGEMLSSDIKGIASSITVEFNWISVFIITSSFDVLVQSFGSAVTFWIFGCIMAAGTAYGSICLFETKGKSSTEIQMRLSGDK